MDLNKLIERLEAATAPDRELDSAIARSLETLPTEPFKTEAPFERLKGMYYVIGKKDTPAGPVEEKWGRCPPLYTFSVDAALTLMPSEGFSIPWSWRIGNLPSGGAFALLGTSLTEHYGASPAIALCVAVLKSRATRVTAMVRTA